jgi:hypothetical protein
MVIVFKNPLKEWSIVWCSHHKLDLEFLTPLEESTRPMHIIITQEPAPISNITHDDEIRGRGVVCV